MPKVPEQGFGAYCRCLIDPKMAAGALRVAFIVGSLLFAINHGPALLQGQMTTARWMSALLSYCVPYMVNIHGRYTNSAR